MSYLKHRLLLIGASTGGPGLIEKIVTSIDHSFDGSIIIAQHMDRVSLASFAKRLDRINIHTKVYFCEKSVQKIDTNSIYLFNKSAILKQNGLLVLEALKNYKGIYHPNINELFFSAADLKDCDIRAYLLSGIGADGAKGLLAIKKAGFICVAQDEQTSIVYGMPKIAKELNATSKIFSIEEIIRDINVFLA